MSQEEINQLRQLVEEAYREGFAEGFYTTIESEFEATRYMRRKWDTSLSKNNIETIEVQHEPRDSTKATAKDI